MHWSTLLPTRAGEAQHTTSGAELQGVNWIAAGVGRESFSSAPIDSTVLPREHFQLKQKEPARARGKTKDLVG